MDEGSSCTAVSIPERVNGFELGVRDGHLRQEGEVGPLGERTEILDRLVNPPIVRRHELRTMGGVVGSAYPDLLVTKLARVGLVLAVHERLVDGQDVLRGQGSGELKSAVHRLDVRLDKLRVRSELGQADIGQRQGPGTDGDVLDL
ncbi:MAG: hypothetical protein QM714_11530 [Nocardioides sp.]